MYVFGQCLKVFLARILDVSLGTVRTMITVKGNRLLAASVGFVEVLIWYVIVKEVLNTTENSLWLGIAYALGFAAGTYLGSYISENYIRGNFGVQVITSSPIEQLVSVLRSEGYGVSVIDVKSELEEEKHLLFLEINKHRFSDLHQLLKKLDPKAFVVVNETKFVQNGYIK